MSMRTPIRPAGFTLLELLVVLALTAVLAALAYPTYTDQIMRTRRGEATAVLAEAAHFMERRGADNLRFDKDLAGVATALPAELRTSPKASQAPHYDVSLQSVSVDSFVLQAVPREGSSQARDPCGTLTISSTGVAGPAEPGCWKR